MPENVFDAIVIGSGISGGWAAKELCEKGLSTIMLERGKNIEHIKDYVNANKDPWEFPHRGGRTNQMVKDYPVLKRDYPLNETNLFLACYVHLVTVKLLLQSIAKPLHLLFQFFPCQSYSLLYSSVYTLLQVLYLPFAIH